MVANHKEHKMDMFFNHHINYNTTTSAVSIFNLLYRFVCLCSFYDEVANIRLCSTQRYFSLITNDELGAVWHNIFNYHPWIHPEGMRMTYAEISHPEVKFIPGASSMQV
jgi:hypothetical protein